MDFILSLSTLDPVHKQMGTSTFWIGILLLLAAGFFWAQYATNRSWESHQRLKSQQLKQQMLDQGQHESAALITAMDDIPDSSHLDLEAAMAFTIFGLGCILFALLFLIGASHGWLS